MSCMEHMCVRCGHLEFNNEPSRVVPCHKCGGTRWNSAWDEEQDMRRAHEEEGDNAENADDTD